MKNINKKEELKKFTYVFIGGILLSLAVVAFLAPNYIFPGGTPGVAMILNYIFDLPLGMLMLIINTPIILLSMKFINKKYGIRTIITILITSFTVDFFREFLGFEGFIIEPILASVYGGVVVGIAIGFIIKGNASPGGPAVVAKLVSHKSSFKEQHILIALDAIIVTLAGLIFKNIETTLLSLITVYVSGKGIALVLSGKIFFK